MTVFARIDAFNQIPGVISRMQVAGAGHRVPLMQALYRGRIAHLELARDSSHGRLKRWAALARLPSVLLLGDDDQAMADGPDTWPCARRAIGWARFVLIHGAVGRPEHYERAIEIAERFGRLLLIECSSANIEAWKAATCRWGNDARGQVMTPAPGIVHPSIHAGQVQ